nr:MAG TPA: hypothetical protein [Inoviridae sp.]
MNEFPPYLGMPPTWSGMESRWPSTATKPACSAVTIRRLRAATAIPSSAERCTS